MRITPLFLERFRRSPRVSKPWLIASRPVAKAGRVFNSFKRQKLLRKQIDGGEYHTCAVLDTNDIRCWGTSSFGQLGYGYNYNVGDDEIGKLKAIILVPWSFKLIWAPLMDTFTMEISK